MGIRSLRQHPSARTPVPIASAPKMTLKDVSVFEAEQGDHDKSIAARKKRIQVKKEKLLQDFTLEIERKG